MKGAIIRCGIYASLLLYEVIRGCATGSAFRMYLLGGLWGILFILNLDVAEKIAVRRELKKDFNNQAVYPIYKVRCKNGK